MRELFVNERNSELWCVCLITAALQIQYFESCLHRRRTHARVVGCDVRATCSTKFEARRRAAALPGPAFLIAGDSAASFRPCRRFPWRTIGGADSCWYRETATRRR